MDNNNKVMVGMSGGIDSTSICLMLIEQGYEPVGMTMITCGTEPKHADEAAEIAKKIGIQHHIADARKDFENTVIAEFVNEYLNGRTPNPCVTCNPLFKFRLLEEYADKHGCKHIATGHYSNITHNNGHYHITRGVDATKDQSYFLWRLDEKILARCMFPLGNYKKQNVREYLKTKGFETKSQSTESMEICFINDNYRDFIKSHCNTSGIEEGWFIKPDGTKLGKHKGIPYYTIGQRKGLGIALGEPAYVIDINAKQNTIMLGDKDMLKAEYMLVENYKFNDIGRIADESPKSVMIRYHGQPIPCKIAIIDEKHLIVKFLAEANAISPGQSAVFYDGNLLLGGGYIANQKPLGQYLNDINNLCFK